MRTGLGVDDLGNLLDQPLIEVSRRDDADDSVMLSPVWFEWHEGGINVWVPRIEGGKVAHVQARPARHGRGGQLDLAVQGLPELRGEATVSTKPDDFYGVLRRTGLRYSGPEAAERMVAEYAPGGGDPARAGHDPRVGLRGRGLTRRPGRGERRGPMRACPIRLPSRLSATPRSLTSSGAAG